jgi:undecaprenyl-diphosphatase
MKKFSIWSVLLLLPFGMGLAVALTECISGFERSVFDLLRVLKPAHGLLVAFTELGDTIGVVSVTALILLVTAITKKYFFTVGMPSAITVIISRIVNVILKNVINRERPEFKVIFADESSFPSGHSQNNMALYIALLICLLLIVSSVKWRVVLTVSLIALPVIIGITRIYLGVHYISDVIAGWSMGAFVAITVNYFYFKIYYRIKDKKDAKA